jgi:hypothetical protein
MAASSVDRGRPSSALVDPIGKCANLIHTRVVVDSLTPSNKLGDRLHLAEKLYASSLTLLQLT